MSSALIVGIGSPYGDDQAGWLTIDALLAKGVQVSAEIVIEKLDRPGANLIPLLEKVSWVILVDAMHSGGPVGRIQRFDQNDWPSYGHGLSSHSFGVLDSLSLARELGSLPSQLDLYGIEIGSASPGEQAGREIQAAAQQLAHHIAGDLAAWTRRA